MALALARRTGAYLELVGSTPAPPDDDPYPDAPDLHALRTAVVTREGLSVRDAEVRVRLLMAQREIRETLALLAATGPGASYASVDVRDAVQVEEHLRDVHARHGRLSLVVFGSGVNLDQLIGRTSQSAFEHVFETKAVGMRAVLGALDATGVVPDAVVAFGSIAAVEGSRGQIGYTAGNDAMEQELAAWGTARGARTVTVSWGPWAPRGHRPGMVSQELERDFARRGKRLLDPEQATACLLDEIAQAGDGPSSVVWAPPGWMTTVRAASPEPVRV
ncbi:SDR family NAD(P)-dependent oxidoreductase [Cellulomonas sp. URHB0016]